jgi:hypothetical protein
MTLTRHADLEVGWSSRRLLLLGGLSEPGLDGEDNSNPAPSQYGTSHGMERETYQPIILCSTCDVSRSYRTNACG